VPFNGSARRTLTEKWNGFSWKIVPSPNEGTGDNRLKGVSCVSKNFCQAVGEYFNKTAARTRAVLGSAFDHHLEDIFLRPGARRPGSRPAWKIVEGHGIALTNVITTWTGVGRPVVREIIHSIAATCRERGFRGIQGKEKDYLVHLTAYATALAINYLTRGKYHRV